MLFCESHDLVWKIISVSEKRMKNCIVKITDNVFEKNDEGGLFPLKEIPNPSSSFCSKTLSIGNFHNTVFHSLFRNTNFISQTTVDYIFRAAGIRSAHGWIIVKTPGDAFRLVIVKFKA